MNIVARCWLLKYLWLSWVAASIRMFTAVASQKKEDFMLACEKVLHFYGGVPEVIVPDNLKSALKKAIRYEADLNDSFAAFAAHYNTYVFPARAYRPKDKALVKGAVKIIYSSIFTEVDKKVYTRGLKNANFRYSASIEQLDYTENRGLDKNQGQRLS